MRLTAAQIAGHARNAGWTGDALATAVAVALGESGGRTDARGDVSLQTGTWGPSIGLWQIRSLNAQRGSGGVRDERANLDPATNARHAHRIWTDAGRTFRPWTVYNIGAHLLHMPAAKKGAAAAPGAVTAVATSGGGASTSGTVTPVSYVPGLVDPGDLLLGQLPGVLGDIPGTDMVELARTALSLPLKVYAWVSDRNNIFRVLSVAVGAGLVITGVVVVAWPALQAGAGAVLGARKQAGRVAKAIN